MSIRSIIFSIVTIYIAPIGSWSRRLCERMICSAKFDSLVGSIWWMASAEYPSVERCRQSDLRRSASVDKIWSLRARLCGDVPSEQSVYSASWRIILSWLCDNIEYSSSWAIVTPKLRAMAIPSKHRLRLGLLSSGSQAIGNILRLKSEIICVISVAESGSRILVIVAIAIEGLRVSVASRAPLRRSESLEWRNFFSSSLS